VHPSKFDDGGIYFLLRELVVIIVVVNAAQTPALPRSFSISVVIINCAPRG
jgi:hypothetical protein